MKYVTPEELKELVSTAAQTSVTIYMPTHRASSPPHIQEDQTRYKNLIRQAEDLMKQNDASHDDQQAIMERLQGMIEDQEFWTHQTDGLAVLADSQSVRCYNMGTNINEYVAVDERFHLSPLMVQAEENQPYLVLALAVHGPKLFEGDSSSFKESEIELPVSPEAALNIDEMHVNQIQARGVRVRQPNTGSAPGIFHGHGGSPRDIESDERLRFFKMIDEVICKHYDDSSRPLVIISTDDQIVEYKTAASYSNIVDTKIEGNRTQEKPDELHRLTWEAITENVVQAKRGKLLEQYEELIAQNRSLSDTTEIQAVATEGRVDTLMLGMLITTTDTVKDQMESVSTVTFPEEFEAIDACALDVFAQGGKIIGFPREHMPEQAAMAAILRY
jgi:hypothetical protein